MNEKYCEYDRFIFKVKCMTVCLTIYDCNCLNLNLIPSIRQINYIEQSKFVIYKYIKK